MRFAQFSNGDVDFMRILKSTDAGDTFSSCRSTSPPRPLTTVLPTVQAGEFLDMGSGGGRLGLHAGPALTGRQRW